MSQQPKPHVFNAKWQREADLKRVLSEPSNLEILTSSSVTSPDDPGLMSLLSQALKLQNLGFEILGSNPDPILQTAFMFFRKSLKDAKSTVAGHYEHRKLQPYSVADLLAALHTGSAPSDLKVDLPTICIVWREHSQAEAGRKFMTESICLRADDIDLLDGYYIVEGDEPVIFLSSKSDEPGFEVELVVIRGAAFKFEHSAEFYAWFQNVVMAACDEHCNTRPNHPGSIVQLGWNAGPRHVTIFGLAKSYAKEIGKNAIIVHDKDAVAVLSIMWGLVESLIPEEVVSEVNMRLDMEGMPCMATRNVEPGPGYEFTIGGKLYCFPHVEWAPPEGYMSQDYVVWTHTDPSYGKYAFAWCVGRDVDLQAPLAFKPGGSFVEVEEHVIVHQAMGTLIAFKPDHQHGTSQLFGAHNRICSINFSSRILDAFNIAKEKDQVIVGDGAGEGDRDNY
ncbi:hypothetical protein PILCRDRAFT_11921 [Piloderma croceum F 1598]|uniref:Uncharacterized protein n=1 Tax=Piloderma croceum (strain F 1598) TaxID=765440 RepID=A0A0C3BJC0_PILCF|nr:hypothetical protein PILCRDRAFT_11921 [Piloderma croceum F 1598]